MIRSQILATSIRNTVTKRTITTTLAAFVLSCCVRAHCRHILRVFVLIPLVTLLILIQTSTCNPIEMVWNWKKDWIQEHYDDNLRGYDELREAVNAAWNAVPMAYLIEPLASMPARCLAVD
jgi:hypothetical protein